MAFVWHICSAVAPLPIQATLVARLKSLLPQETRQSKVQHKPGEVVCLFPSANRHSRGYTHSIASSFPLLVSACRLSAIFDLSKL